MPTYAECKEIGRRTVTTLIDGNSGTPYQRRVMGLHQDLVQLGFHLVENQVFGPPPDGRQLLYAFSALTDKHDRTILVRVKTRGNGQPPRQGVAHMAVSLIQGDRDWDGERAKFNRLGQIVAKMTSDGEKVPEKGFSFPTLLETGITPAGLDAWAGNCHFNFAPGFDISGALTLIPDK